ncbi:gamma-glutamylcyclotransferase family protein [Deinococcus radiodurans]|jgi:Uncharacterized conserved protein|nr:gamma-glutamylcyclotransferase [Deinococcus radiodurans]ANC72415.1 hypothetical protein A2G07_11895 [Deinococcus radiodurans R1 = ATCC 13939 = DSM 20539]QIP28528.1 gamma-glutamylcyclotransferase [Deinococcus radiodurans]QIP32758.1 gamma-glutamylcyclotransferase [Deinococcus radiodurans]UID69333.1 hypothetical protein DRO_0325 [Deinococcus radiodurans R1 = ATCC 13939 = DSM 20539]UTA49919.1 gamma-glutamylcyclotransferase [Deinococcus radiodurans]
MVPLLPVFVYGTLLPGERNAHIAAQGGEFTVRPATLRGFRLFDLRPESYPGIVPGAADDLIHGALLTYGPADWEQALALLDELEGVDEMPPVYTREQVRLTLEGGETLTAWVYVYALADRLRQTGAVLVPEGDWRGVADR